MRRIDRRGVHEVPERKTERSVRLLMLWPPVFAAIFRSPALRISSRYRKAFSFVTFKPQYFVTDPHDSLHIRRSISKRRRLKLKHLPPFESAFCSPYVISLIHISEPTRLLSISYA